MISLDPYSSFPSSFFEPNFEPLFPNLLPDATSSSLSLRLRFDSHSPSSSNWDSDYGGDWSRFFIRGLDCEGDWTNLVALVPWGNQCLGSTTSTIGYFSMEPLDSLSVSSSLRCQMEGQAYLLGICFMSFFGAICTWWKKIISYSYEEKIKTNKNLKHE